MRIWAFPSFYPLDHPGLKWNGIFAHRQYKGLTENGAELKVILPVLWFPPKPLSNLHPHWKELTKLTYPAKRTYDGIEVFHPRIANMKPGLIFKKKYDERFAESVVHFFKSNKIKLDPAKDVFYSQWTPNSAMVQAAAKRLGVKSAVLVIGDDVIVWPHERKENLNLFCKTWKEADYRIAVAAYLAKEANKLNGEDLPYFVVRRGVEHSKFKPVTHEAKMQLRAELHLPPNKLVILSVGSPIKRKGWLDLFDALVMLKKVNTNFLLVGIHSGPKDIDLAAEATKRNLDDCFLNMGEVDPQKINKFYNASDIFCLPSHWEGIANAVVEAMSCGLPVITTNVSGHPELVINGNNGIMIPPKQPQLLYNELSMLVTNEQKREELGTNARNFIVNEWGSFAQNSLKLYNILSK